MYRLIPLSLISRVRLALILSVLSGCYATLARGEIRVIDDVGTTLTIPGPAQRILSLAPHITELLFSAGAGDRVVGVVSYSDYPAAARKIPLIGSYDRLDLEQMLALKPDLIVGWQSGNPQAALDHVLRLGIPVYLTEPRTFADIATNIERLGILAGTREVSNEVASGFLADLEQLRIRYQNSPPVSVFYQVWREPLMTFNGDHLFNQMVELCGGRNLFTDLPRLASPIDQEAVLMADPEIFIVGEVNNAWLDDWRHWSTLRAVRTDRLYALNQDLLVRPTLRTLDGIRELCAVLQPQL
ncbi:MAG: iron complex transport system substrate-binding protein [Motiliproteus sp.]|jgi:iron complex transport system substrate-binding protein